MTHYNNLIELDSFIRKTYDACLQIRDLNPMFFKLSYDYSSTGRLGLFVFPNRIILYVNTLSILGEDINANKTYILYTIMHELYHATQDLSKGVGQALEDAADMMTYKMITIYKDRLESCLGFTIDQEILNTQYAIIKDNETPYAYRDYEFTYRRILAHMVKSTKIDHLLEGGTLGLVIIIPGFEPRGFIIRDSKGYRDPSILIEYISNTISNFSDIEYTIEKDGKCFIIYTVKSYTIKPIK